MTDPLSDFVEQLRDGQALCLLPIDRVLVEEPIRLQTDVIVYPPDHIDPASLRVVLWPKRDLAELTRKHGFPTGDGKIRIKLEGDALHWYKSAATEIDLPVFFGSALIATTIPFDWDLFLAPPNHETHLQLIANASEKLEAAFDLVRLAYCNPWLPAILPGRVGYLSEAGFSSALFYSGENHESYIVAGELLTHTIISGLGLDMTQVQFLPEVGEGEVGKIARRGLNMHSAALEANSETSKFVQHLSLLEFLAYPDDYKGMEDVSKQIAKHFSQSRAEHDAVLEDFYYLTSDGRKGKDQNKGLRHNIVHIGNRIEDMLDSTERLAVFKRLCRYTGTVLEFLIENSSSDWAAVELFRQDAAIRLGISRPEDFGRNRGAGGK